MNDECDKIPHPWGKFLDARLDCIKWMRQQGKSDRQIAYDLSMDEKQVQSIRNALKID